MPDKALQNLRKEEKLKEKIKTYPSECSIPKNSKKRLKKKKAFLSDQGKEIEENIRMANTRDLFKKIRDREGTF